MLISNKLADLERRCKAIKLGYSSLPCKETFYFTSRRIMYVLIKQKRNSLFCFLFKTAIHFLTDKRAGSKLKDKNSTQSSLGNKQSKQTEARNK